MRKNVTKKIKGPRWVCEVDRPDLSAVVGGDFPSRCEALQFYSANPGNASIYQVGPGREVEYTVYAYHPKMKGNMEQWAQDLRAHGTTE